MQIQIRLFLFLLLSFFLLGLLEAVVIRKTPNHKGKGKALKVKGKPIVKNSGMQKFEQKNVKKGAEIAGLLGLSKSANVKHPDHTEASNEAIAGLLQLQEQPIFANSPSRNQGLSHHLQAAEHAATPVQDVATPEYPPEHDAPPSLMPHMESMVVRQHLLDQEMEERLQLKKLVNTLPPYIPHPNDPFWDRDEHFLPRLSDFGDLPQQYPVSAHQ